MRHAAERVERRSGRRWSPPGDVHGLRRVLLGSVDDMAFTFDPGADVLDELRNIAHDQLGAAISDLVEPGDDLVEAIHDCRKRCKKLRGLVRLVRPALGDQYSDANATFRDAGRELTRCVTPMHSRDLRGTRRGSTRPPRSRGARRRE